MFEKEEIIPLEEDVFRLIRDFVRDYCGIYFDDDSRYLLEKRLSRRVRNHSISIISGNTTDTCCITRTGMKNLPQS